MVIRTYKVRWTGPQVLTNTVTENVYQKCDTLLLEMSTRNMIHPSAFWTLEQGKYGKN